MKKKFSFLAAVFAAACAGSYLIGFSKTKNRESVKVEEKYIREEKDEETSRIKFKKNQYQVKNGQRINPAIIIQKELKKRILIAAINNELNKKEDEIYSIAAKMHEKLGCYNTLEEASRYYLYLINHTAEKAFFSFGSGADISGLEERLKNISGDNIKIRDDITSIVDIVAIGRYYEICLTESGGNGSGLFDIYREYTEAVAAGECENAVSLAVEAGDFVKKYEALKYCTSMDINEGDMVNFFSEVINAETEDELISSAQVLSYEDQISWVYVCAINRVRRYDLSYYESDAYCVADLIRYGITDRQTEDFFEL